MIDRIGLTTMSGIASMAGKHFVRCGIIRSAPYIYVAQLFNFRSEKGGQLKLARATTACAPFAAIA